MGTRKRAQKLESKFNQMFNLNNLLTIFNQSKLDWNEVNASFLGNLLSRFSKKYNWNTEDGIEFETSSLEQRDFGE